MIHFNNVSKSYSHYNSVLARMNFHLPRGEMAFVVGRSGWGKSTLLRLILALQRPTQGEIIVAGKNLARLKSSEILALRRTCGVMWQEPCLLATHTIFENVALPLALQQLPEQVIIQRVSVVLDKTGLSGQAGCYPPQLSFVQKRLVSLARAMVHEPALLLVDEPTAHFDSRQAAAIIQLLVEINRSGATLLVTTSDLNQIAALPYRILSLKQGN